MKRTIVALALVVIAGVAWWLGSPLLMDDVVNEEFPVVTQEGNVNSDEEDGSGDDVMELPSEEEMAEMSEEELAELKKEMEEKAKDMPDVMVEEKMPGMNDTPEQKEVETKSLPIMVGEGSLKGADSFHQGSGAVKLFQQPDGSHVLRFENLDVTNGPDLKVYLTKVAGVSSSEEVKQGFYNIAPLKGNKGNQNYVIPADVDVNDFAGVAIYCRAFSTLFASSSL